MISSNGSGSYVHGSNLIIDGVGSSKYGAYAESMGIIELVDGCSIKKCDINVLCLEDSMITLSECIIGESSNHGINSKGILTLFYNCEINSPIYVSNGLLKSTSDNDSHKNIINSTIECKQAKLDITYADVKGRLTAHDSVVKVNASLFGEIYMYMCNGSFDGFSLNTAKSYGIYLIGSTLTIDGNNNIGAENAGISARCGSIVRIESGVTNINAIYGIRLNSKSIYNGKADSLTCDGRRFNISYPPTDFESFMIQEMCYVEET